MVSILGNFSEPCHIRTYAWDFTESRDVSYMYDLRSVSFRVVLCSNHQAHPHTMLDSLLLVIICFVSSILSQLADVATCTV